jgi:hypothetical protein
MRQKRGIAKRKNSDVEPVGEMYITDCTKKENETPRSSAELFIRL